MLEDATPRTDCRILLISGSLRGGSTNSVVVETAARVAPEGIRAQVYCELGALPHFNPDDDVTVPPSVAHLNASAQGAAGGAHATLRVVLGYVSADVVELSARAQRRRRLLAARYLFFHSVNAFFTSSA